MNTINFVKTALGHGTGYALAILSDMKDAPLVQPSSTGGNHPLWLLGHIAYSESFLLDECIRGEPNRFAKWESLFKHGTKPVSDAAAYPSFDEVLAAFEAVRADTLAQLSRLSEADLDRKSHVQDRGPVFETIAGCCAALIIHMMYHAGQAAVARRAAGRKPLVM